MKYIFLLLFLCIVSTAARCQKAGNAGLASYEVSLSFKGAIPQALQGTLSFNDISSLFVYDKNTLEAPKQQSQVVNGSEMQIYSKGKATDNIGKMVYSNFGDKTVVERNFIQTSPFVIKDTLRQINWQLDGSTRDISGFRCQRASARVYGREFEVWFAQDVPFPYGPWKLQGLPGLIMEARSLDNEVKFLITKIQLNQPGDVNISAPANGTGITSYAAFYELQNKKTEDWLKSVQAAMADAQAAKPYSTAKFKLKANVVRIERTPTF